MHPATTPWTTIELDEAVEAATARALEKFPEAAARIGRGRAIVQQDGVTNNGLVLKDSWTVRSVSEPGTSYLVVSNGRHTCTCADHQVRQHWCKHIWAVLLIRAVWKQMQQPRRHHGYHLARGEEGHVRRINAERVEFFPGGHQSSVVCHPDEVCIGPLVARSY